MNFRKIITVIVLLGGAGLSARGDTIFVTGADKPVVGDVKSEDAKAVVVSAAKKANQSIPGADVTDIHYESLGPTDLRLKDGAYKNAKDADKAANETSDPVARKAALAAAIANYGETLKKMNPHKFANRTIEYRIAILTVKQALTEQRPTDKALARLQSFKTRFPDSWQINHVMPLIAQLQVSAGDTKGAEQTFAEMAEMEVLPPEVRRNAELEVVKVSLRAGNIKQAEVKLEALSKKASDKQFVSRITMLKAGVLAGQKNYKAAVPLLNQVIKDNNDKLIKAEAHNTLGECFFAAKDFNEAVWEFLWVDAVYNQDKHEHAKALYYLWKTFEQLNNAERAQECQQQLINDRQLTGTEYQRKALEK